MNNKNHKKTYFLLIFQQHLLTVLQYFRTGPFPGHEMFTDFANEKKKNTKISCLSQYDFNYLFIQL